MKAKKAGRKRRMLGWTLLTLGVLVAGMWVWSGWNWLTIYYHFKSARSISIGFGRIDSTPGHQALGNYPQSGGPRWVYWYSKSTGYYSGLISYAYPLWPIPLLLWTPAALLLRSGIVARRRTITNACPKCGYSLAGLTAGAACPECGKGAGTT